MVPKEMDSQGGIKKMILGASIEDITEGRNMEIPVLYDMIASHVADTTGQSIDPSSIKEFQRKLVRATNCPAFSKVIIHLIYIYSTSYTLIFFDK
jgi:hypothetical protein